MKRSEINKNNKLRRGKKARNISLKFAVLALAVAAMFTLASCDYYETMPIDSGNDDSTQAEVNATDGSTDEQSETDGQDENDDNTDANAAEDENGSDASSTSASSSSNNSSTSSATGTKICKDAIAKVKDMSAPWESFDMTGLPDKLDIRMSDDGDVLVLVNKLHAVSKNYKPTNMVYMDNSLTTWQNLELKSDAYEAYLKLYKDAKAEGFNLKVCSAYRTYETQKSLYTSSVNSMGKETANIRSAYRGRSEHHTGYAIDVTSESMGWGLKQNFADYPDGAWINEHCAEYGFIIRYPKDKTDITGYDYEPWHLRYVGVDVAKEITEQGITLEEYLQK